MRVLHWSIGGGHHRQERGNAACRDQLDGPLGPVLDGAGNLYVTDSVLSRIQKLSPERQPLMAWGEERPEGTGPADFASPLLLALDSRGMLYVSEDGNGRVKRMSVVP